MALWWDSPALWRILPGRIRLYIVQPNEICFFRRTDNKVVCIILFFGVLALAFLVADSDRWWATQLSNPPQTKSRKLYQSAHQTNTHRKTVEIMKWNCLNGRVVCGGERSTPEMVFIFSLSVIFWWTKFVTLFLPCVYDAVFSRSMCFVDDTFSVRKRNDGRWFMLWLSMRCFYVGPCGCGRTFTITIISGGDLWDRRSLRRAGGGSWTLTVTRAEI